ncbi:MAG: cyclic nucleotide-binding domain-containing protein [Caldilineaceae bacterium]|nr:cyclic nucleotide-binding domain-containing protein [Caldilineaceae bacterium]
MLSYLYDRQAVLRARDNLVHPAADKRAYALEILDVLLEPRHKSLLFPLFQELTPAARLARFAHDFPQHSEPLQSRLQELISASSARVDVWTKACAIYATGNASIEDADDELLNAVAAALSSPEATLRDAAFWALYAAAPTRLRTEVTKPQQADAQQNHLLLARLDTLTQGDTAMLSTIERVLFLRSVELFEQVPDDVLAWVAQSAQEVHLAKGDRFIAQGDLGDSLFVVVDGQVDILIEGKGRVANRGARSVHGEMGILASQPRTASCVAASDMTALKISREDFLDLLSEAPQLALGVIHVLVDRLDEASQKVASAAPVLS